MLSGDDRFQRAIDGLNWENKKGNKMDIDKIIAEIVDETLNELTAPARGEQPKFTRFERIKRYIELWEEKKKRYTQLSKRE